MTDFLHAFWLAVLQGITEFLPVSSSGHLVLLPRVFGWDDQGLAFDVAVHVGSLIAVILYFRSDLLHIIVDWLKAIVGGEKTVHSQLAWYLIVGTAMIGVAGILMEPLVNRWLRAPLPVAIATMGFALLLWWYDCKGSKKRTMDSLGWSDAIVIGAAQILALIPGTSRSGITITAGLALGLTREAAARFSFLMAIPVIVIAGMWQTRQLAYSPEVVNWKLLLFAAMVSAVVAFVCIHWFLSFVQRFGMLPFVIYRLVLGMILLLWFL